MINLFDDKILRRDILGGISALGLLSCIGCTMGKRIEGNIMAQKPPNDWEFFYGKWDVEHRRLKARLSGSTEWEEFSGKSTVGPLLGGYGNYDDNILNLPSGPYRALSLRSYSEEDDSWAIWWLDGRNPHGLETPVIGRFVDRVGIFYAEDEFNGKPIKIRFLWTDTHTDVPRWEQAFSNDEGESWEINWTMKFIRT